VGGVGRGRGGCGKMVSSTSRERVAMSLINT
jgi:hypothetical protein